MCLWEGVGGGGGWVGAQCAWMIEVCMGDGCCVYIGLYLYRTGKWYSILSMT